MKLIKIARSWGWEKVNAYQMLEILGVKVLPVEGMPEQIIQGVRVYVKAKPTAIGGGMAGLRVMAICECGQHVAVGRMHQHICK